MLAAAAALAIAASALAQQPLVRPADPDATASARVVVAVQPVGRINSDGLTLPLTSPDARFIASQSSLGGRAPAWEHVLGIGAQTPPAGVRITVQELKLPRPAEGDGKPSPPSLKECQPADPMSRGLLLGRSADDAGFLVEAPQDSGSRWIGRVGWLDQRVTWLVRSDHVNAQAALAPQAGAERLANIAYVRRSRERGSVFNELVVTAAADRPAAGFSAAEGEVLGFPLFSADGRTVAVLSARERGTGGAAIQLVSLEIHTGETGADGQGRLGLRVIGRIDLGTAAGPGVEGATHAMYQCVAAVQTPAVFAERPSGPASLFAEGVSVLSPRDAAPMWWDARSDRVVTAARGTLVAMPFHHAEWGVLVAGNAGLGYQPIRSADRGPTFGREVQVLAGRSIPRATTHRFEPPDGVTLTLLLAAPKSGDENGFELMLVAPTKSE